MTAMIYFHDTTDFYMAGPTAITLGKFDGIHKGHQKLLKRILALPSGAQSSVVFMLNPRKDSLILSENEQNRILDEMGVDCLVRCPFIPQISQLEPEEFIEEFLVKRLHVRYVCVGTDFRFGHNRAGDAALLRKCGEQAGFQTDIIEKAKYGDREISSTYIREALQKADMDLVRDLMGRAYALEGIVIHGKHLGTKIETPTANLIPEPGKLLPPDGVYVTETLVDETVYRSITDIGTKPTVEGRFRAAETYIYDDPGDIYGRKIRVLLKKFLRPEKKFASVEELKAQIFKDVEAGRAYFS